ncbi:hypothetical protein AAC387_Pa01g3228 [Persea americana]
MLSSHAQITQQVTKLKTHAPNLLHAKTLARGVTHYNLDSSTHYTSHFTLHFISLCYFLFTYTCALLALTTPHHTTPCTTLHIEAHSHLLLHFSYLHSPNGTRLIFMDVGIGRWWRVWLVVDHVAPLVAIYEGWWIHVGECEVVGACGLLWKNERERERERERESLGE